MSTFLSIYADKSTTILNSIHEVLSQEHLLEVARETKFTIRQRNFDPAVYTLIAIAYCMTSPKEREFRLIRLAMKYNEETGSNLAPKNIYDQLCKPEAKEFTKRITTELLHVVSNIVGEQIKGALPTDIHELLRLLKVNDIILIDGVEVALFPGCAANFDCKGKGRKNLDGSDAKPGLKLHVAFSLLTMTFSYVEVTGACGNEKQQVLPERFDNCLLIMDRGYVNDELEQRISSNGKNKYIIKGKRNMAGTIIRAFKPNGKEATKHIGKKVKDLPKNANLDMDVRLSNGEVIRVIQHVKPKQSRDDNPVVLLRTNLPRKIACFEQIVKIYRIRWQVELDAKCLKSGNALQSINSCKENVIMNFINFTLMASLVKTYFGLKAILKRKIAMTSLSMLKIQCYGYFFKDRLIRLCTKSINIRTQIFKELLDFIESNCRRSPPSKRDQKLLKDLPTLVAHILKIKNCFSS